MSHQGNEAASKRQRATPSMPPPVSPTAPHVTQQQVRPNLFSPTRPSPVSSSMAGTVATRSPVTRSPPRSPVRAPPPRSPLPHIADGHTAADGVSASSLIPRAPPSAGARLSPKGRPAPVPSGVGAFSSPTRATGQLPAWSSPSGGGTTTTPETSRSRSPHHNIPPELRHGTNLPVELQSLPFGDVDNSDGTDDDPPLEPLPVSSSNRNDTPSQNGETAAAETAQSPSRGQTDQLLDAPVRTRTREYIAKSSTASNKERRKYILAAVVLLLLIGVGVGVGMALSSSSSSDNREESAVSPDPKGDDMATKTSDETSSPTVAPPTLDPELWASLREKLMYLSSDPSVLDDIASPQYKAMEWLVGWDYQATFSDMNESDELFNQRLQNRYALAVLYFSTQGENSWTDPLNFLSTSRHECDWNGDGNGSVNGVFCEYADDDSRITRLQLESNNLDSTLPEEIAGLSSLERLIILKNNDLTGNLPTRLGFLTLLSDVVLNENALSGSLPTQIGAWTKLTFLNLFGNQMSGSLPSELGRLSSVATLDLRSNKFQSQIPSELGQMSSLRLLLLAANNGLSGSLPSQLGLLSNLMELDLRINGLEGVVPMELGALTALTSLTIRETTLDGPIPATFGQLTGLQSLDLSGNFLSGTLPTNVGRLIELTSMQLRFNFLDGKLPSELGLLTGLQLLDLSSNSFTGPIPTELTNLTNLRNFNIISNSLSGLVPENFCSDPLFNFEDLVADCNIKVTCGCCTQCG